MGLLRLTDRADGAAVAAVAGLAAAWLAILAALASAAASLRTRHAVGAGAQAACGPADFCELDTARWAALEVWSPPRGGGGARTRVAGCKTALHVLTALTALTLIATWAWAAHRVVAERPRPRARLAASAALFLAAALATAWSLHASFGLRDTDAYGTGGAAASAARVAAMVRGAVGRVAGPSAALAGLAAVMVIALAVFEWPTAPARDLHAPLLWALLGLLGLSALLNTAGAARHLVTLRETFQAYEARLDTVRTSLRALALDAPDRAAPGLRRHLARLVRAHAGPDISELEDAALLDKFAGELHLHLHHARGRELAAFEEDFAPDQAEAVAELRSAMAELRHGRDTARLAAAVGAFGSETVGGLAALAACAGAVGWHAAYSADALMTTVGTGLGLAALLAVGTGYAWVRARLG